MSFRRGWQIGPALLAIFLFQFGAKIGSGQPSSTGTLAVSVVDSATGAGIPHVLISYNGPASGYRFTDAGGAIRVESVPVGRYNLTISKPGFISNQDSSPGANELIQQSGPFGAVSAAPTPPAVNPTHQFLDLTADSKATTIELAPVAAIDGFVLDENSEPLIGVSLQAIAIKTALTGTDYASVQSGTTDDRGHYSLLNLPPGDYLLRLAGERSTTRFFSGTLNPDNDHRGLPPVYYPNGDTTSTASVLRLSPGEKISANFQRATESAFDINGHLSGFAPGAWAQLQLYREGDRIPVGQAFVNLTTGQFRLVDVPRGDYTLRAEQYQADPPHWFAAEVTVMIDSQPIRNLAVELVAGADIPVSVSYESGAQPDGPVLLMLRAHHSAGNGRQLTVGKAIQMPARGNAAQRSGAAQTDPPAMQPPNALTNVIPDVYSLTTQTIGPGQDYVASARLGDQDVLHGEFRIGGNAGGELRVTVKGDSANVEGQVTIQGQPAPMAQVFIIPISGDGSALRRGYSDQNGHYRVAGVPPGEYRLRAWKGSPAAKDVFSQSGETLTLQPSEHRTVAIEAIEGKDPSRP